MTVLLADIQCISGSVGRRHLPCSSSRLLVLIGEVFCQYLNVLHLGDYGLNAGPAPEQLLEGLVWLQHHCLDQVHTVSKQSHFLGSVVAIFDHSDIEDTSTMLVFTGTKVKFPLIYHVRKGNFIFLPVVLV